jgi:PAS domain S-box-containing protein
VEQGSLTETMRATLALFAESGAPQTTTEVADRLDLGRRATYGRLERLAEKGRLETKKVGANARVWWRPATNSGTASPEWPAAAESLVEDVLDEVEVGIFVLDENFDVAWLNGATERYFGLDRGHALGRNKRRLVDEHIAALVEDSRAFAETVLATYDENTYTEQFECHVTGQDDREERWLEHRSKPIESGAYAGGRVELYYDVTERTRSERARQTDRKQFESLVEAVEEYAIFLLDPDGYVETWNPGAERIKGYTPDEIVGEHVSTFYTEEAREDGVPDQNLEAAAAEGSRRDEGWRVRRDGSTFWADVTITAIRDDEGTLEGYAKVTHDLTERREREQELREEKAFTESILDNQQDLVYAFDTDGTLLRWNDSFHEVTGYTDAEIEAMRPEDFVADEATDELGAALTRVFEQGERATVELPLVTADGDEIPYEFTGGPLTNDAGDVVGITGVGRDVSDQKARERLLERPRDDLENELDEVFHRIDDAVYGLDEEWRFTYLNDSAEELFGRTEAELGGKNVWDAFPDALDRSYRERYERAMETQEPVTFEEFSDTVGAWLEVTAYPSESGLSVYFRDVTERKVRERELELYETIVETIWDGVYALDSDDRFVLVNQAFCDIVGYEREELLGRHPTLVNSETVNETANELETDVTDGERDVGVLEYEFETADGTTVPVETRFGPYEYRDGRYGRCGVTRDISERKERERELEESRRRYRTLVDSFPNGIVALFDDDFRYLLAGGELYERLGRSPDETVGKTLYERNTPEEVELLEPHFRAALDGESRSFQIDYDGLVLQFRTIPVTDEDGDVFAGMAMSQDVTEQREYEQYLEDAKSQLEAATEAGAIGTWEWNVTDDELVTGASFAEMFGVDPDAAREGVTLDQFVDAIHEDDRERVEREIEAALASCEAYEAEYRVRNADGEYRWVVARGRVQCDEDGDPVTFPGALTDITDRKEAELELQRRQEQLAALNNVNEVVRDVTSAVIEQSTREEIEEIVCERLAESDSYTFAWVSEVDPTTGAVEERTEAGVDGYLDDISLSVNPDVAEGRGPTGEAIRTREVQVANALEDADFEPWREYARQYGYQSSAAIPVVHGGTLYGVLGVYADRPRAFDGKERTVVSQLGEIVGHAIAAAERKRALMSDELVELEFKIADVFGSLGGSIGTSGTITLDHTVPLGDGEFVVYGAATADAVGTVHELVERHPHWESVTFHSEGESAGFELRVTEPPVLSMVAAHGGYVDETVIEDGDVRMTVHLAPSVDVRQVIAAVEETYPNAEMLRRRQVTREPDDSRRFQRRLVADLTDRQRTALEAAYHSGFFEWPRDTSGAEVAELLGVAPPTFHQHLRKAQRKVFETVFSPDTGETV